MTPAARVPVAPVCAGYCAGCGCASTWCAGGCGCGCGACGCSYCPSTAATGAVLKPGQLAAALTYPSLTSWGAR